MLDMSVPPAALPPVSLLTTAEWQGRASAHLERVQQWTTPRRQRRSRREVHPVYDFLFQYYHFPASRLELWHPDPHEQLADSPEARDRFVAPVYCWADGVICRNALALTANERDSLTRMVELLRATHDRAPNFACYGMHEWAMVYGGYEVRHAEIAPLRLPQAQVDAFVGSRPVSCSHFDAFRFFAPEAKPLNRVPLSWDSRHELEQPGCIHANMDLYRWAYTSMPWIGSALLWDCFELAIALRVLDMQAGPYDLQSIGFEPVRIETAAGRAEYQHRQRELSARAGVLRSRLIDSVSAVL